MIVFVCAARKVARCVWNPDDVCLPLDVDGRRGLNDNSSRKNEVKPVVCVCMEQGKQSQI
jgi:hypothetical protein